MAHLETTRSSASKGDCGGARRQRCACGVGEGVGCEDGGSDGGGGGGAGGGGGGGGGASGEEIKVAVLAMHPLKPLWQASQLVT